MTVRPVCLHVVTSLDFGGVESHMRILAEHGALARFDHRFCAIHNGGATATALLARGVSPVILKVRAAIPSLAAARGLVRLIRAMRPTVLHLHGAEANFHGVLAGWLCRVPLCLAEEIGIPRHSRKARRVFRQIYRLADGVIAISQAVKREIVALGEADDDHIHVVLNPVAMLPEKPLAPLANPLQIGFVGRLEEIKNPIAVVRAAAILQRRGLSIDVRIVGEGSQRRMLQQEIEAQGLGDSVSLLGFQPDPFDRLAGCHLYVQPSLSEGFGLAIVEAMSAGFPVIATAVGGVPEIIEHGVNGWLLPDSNASTLADMLSDVAAKGPQALAATGRKARQSVLTRFAPEAYFDRCEGLYWTLLAKKGTMKGGLAERQ